MKRVPLERNRLKHLPEWSRRIFLGLFAADLVLVGVRLAMPPPLTAPVRWPEGLLITLAGGCLLASLATQLPGENVVLGAAVIASISSGSIILDGLTGIPFGGLRFRPRFGQELFHPLPWAIPILWITLVLAARGTARLVLRPWRSGKNYGLWLMGLAAVVIILFDLSFEPVATRACDYWSWSLVGGAWHGSAPAVNYLGWLVTALLCLLFVMPPLLNKKPGPPPPPDPYPLVILDGLWALVALEAFCHGLWFSAWLSLSCFCLATAMALMPLFRRRNQ